jgi:hypothetical protein
MAGKFLRVTDVSWQFFSSKFLRFLQCLSILYVVTTHYLDSVFIRPERMEDGKTGQEGGSLLQPGEGAIEPQPENNGNTMSSTASATV